MFLDGLFDSFGEETISDDDYVWNYDDVGKFNNETDHASRIILDQYLDASDEKNVQNKTRARALQCNIVQLILLADYHTFRKYTISLFIKCIFSSHILT